MKEAQRTSQPRTGQPFFGFRPRQHALHEPRMLSISDRCGRILRYRQEVDPVPSREIRKFLKARAGDQHAPSPRAAGSLTSSTHRTPSAQGTRWR